MAKQNKVEFVEIMLPEAVDYIQHTNEYDWQNHNLYERIGNAFAGIGNYNASIKYLEMSWNGSPSNSMRSISNLGISYYFKPDYQKSISYLKKAEGMINDSTNNVTRKVLYSYLNTAYSNAQNYAEAIKYAEIAAPYIKEIDGNDVYAKHLTMWAIDCGNAHQYQEAQRLFEEAKGLFSIVSDNTKVTYYSEYGFYLIKTNEIPRATDVLKNGIKLCVESLGEDYALLTTMYHNLGRAYMLQQDYANALLYLNKSKDLQIKLNGKAMQRTLDYIKECESK
jgi:tetratricopeptide (TPR) repeat protein